MIEGPAPGPLPGRAALGRSALAYMCTCRVVLSQVGGREGSQGALGHSLDERRENGQGYRQGRAQLGARHR